MVGCAVLHGVVFARLLLFKTSELRHFLALEVRLGSGMQADDGIRFSFDVRGFVEFVLLGGRLLPLGCILVVLFTSDSRSWSLLVLLLDRRHLFFSKANSCAYFFPLSSLAPVDSVRKSQISGSSVFDNGKWCHDP